MLLASMAMLPAATVPLGELDPESSSQGWGQVQLDMAVAGKPLAIAGRKFARGIGTHANSKITYDLAGAYDMFSAMIGVDDFLKDHPEAGKASVVFRITGDGKVLYDSGVMRMGDAAKAVRIPVKGVQEFALVVTDAGDGISCDHADWADPVLSGDIASRQDDKPTQRLEAGKLTVNLADNGSLVDAAIGGTAWPVTGSTRLAGMRPVGKPVVDTALPGGARAITRVLTDGSGRKCTVTDKFTPEHDSVRWDVTLTSADPVWSTPVITRLQCSRPEDTLIWTAWGSPDFSSGVNMSPELTAQVQAGKVAAGGGHWSDPLNPVGFPNRSWHYGNVAQNCPVGSDYIALPLLTMLSPPSGTGLSLVLAPDDILLTLDLAVSSNGRIQFTRANHRLGGGKPVTFTMHLVAHESSWRGGLRFMTTRYPGYFDPPNPRAHTFAGCGAYTLCEAPIDVAKFKDMAFGFNWKLSDDFPYMGMFIPPVNDAGEKWTRSCGEPAPAGQGPETSCAQMNAHAKYMKENGFGVLSYFNVTEFGKDMNRGGQRQPKLAADAPDLWKDPAAYLKYRLPTAVFDPGITTCYYAYITDPGDPDYQNHLLEQAARNTSLLPDTDGICIDRADWLRIYNPTADDGASWINGKPARSLFRSWIGLMARMGPQMHAADKLIFSNMMTMRLELCKELDGIYTEFGNNGNALNGSAMLGLRKPVVAWSYNETLRQPDPDAFMQRHLHLGAFPTAPYPNNNHCINPSPEADQLYLAYGPLLNSMRGKKWVLAPRCVESTTPAVKVNLFEVPGGYALPITFGGGASTATVQLRNLPGMEKLAASAILPGAGAPIHVVTTIKDGVLTLTVPLARGCAMVKLVPAR